MTNSLAKIFESPDGGKTVYMRNFGDSTRVRVHPTWDQPDLFDNNYQLWYDILEAAKTNPALLSILNELVMTYNLIKQSEDGDN